MKKIILILSLVMVLFIIGCSELGYETKWETDRRLCEQCADSCGHIPPNEFGNIYMDCIENCHNELNRTDCNDYCVNQWNNRTDVKDYQECYKEKCNWICS